MDALHAEVTALAKDPAVTIARLHALAAQRAGRPYVSGVRLPSPERPIPARLTEPWFC